MSNQDCAADLPIARALHVILSHATTRRETVTRELTPERREVVDIMLAAGGRMSAQAIHRRRQLCAPTTGVQATMQLLYRLQHLEIVDFVMGSCPLQMRSYQKIKLWGLVG